MLRAFLKSLIFFWLIQQGAGCREKRSTQRAFYFWKSEFRLTDFEKNLLSSLHATRLYIKYFDVSWDPLQNTPLPVARVDIEKNSREWINTSAIETIPVIFITNEVIRNSSEITINALAEKIHLLLASMQKLHPFVKSNEVQIDCDWTAETKTKYFELLEHIKKLRDTSEISATIRLYQCKYRDKTGVPPVNKGLLMCYNMGNLKNPSTDNSIIDAEELDKYIGNLDDYPLPLDIALPAFSWKVLYRKQIYSGLIQQLPDSVLTHPSLSVMENNRFRLLCDTILLGYELKKGDILRNEESRYDEILKAAKKLSPKFKTNNFTVSLYHLDSSTLSKFKLNELENIYNSLH